MKFNLDREIGSLRLGKFSFGVSQSLQTPLIAHSLNSPWFLTTRELTELGVQSLVASRLHIKTHFPEGIPAWSGCVLTTSGLVEAELGGLTTKWSLDSVDVKSADSGSMVKIDLGPQTKAPLRSTLNSIAQPVVLSTTSQTKRKIVLKYSASWFAAAVAPNLQDTSFTIVESCIQDDLQLLAQWWSQLPVVQGIATWHTLSSLSIPSEVLRWHLGIETWDAFLERLYEGADILSSEFLYTATKNGQVLTAVNWFDIRDSDMEFSQEPLDGQCRCETCQNFTRSYLHHLLENTPTLAERILAIHNTYYLEFLMQNLRNALETGRFAGFEISYPVMKRM